MEPLRFLLGKWVSPPAETQLGRASGDATFWLMLNGRIMVRDGFADYGTAKTAPPRHDDMMVVYAEGPKDALNAIYCDSEGHTIHYNVTIGAPGSVRFESDPAQPGPKYRLSYQRQRDTLAGQFEIDGKTYLSWTSKLASAR